MNIAKLVIFTEFARASLPTTRFDAISVQEVNHVFFVRMLYHVQLLLRVCEFVYHQALNVTQTFYNLFLHLSCFKLADHFIYMRILSAEVLLL